MGYVIPDLGFGWEPVGGAWWLVLTVSRGDPPHHSGFAVGPYDEIRDDAGQTVAAVLIASATDGEASFADEIADIDAVNAGPFPGVVPADWWAGLPALVKGAVIDGLEAWASANALP